jgi:hypothetical protein
MTACSDTSTKAKPKEPEKPAEPVTGQSAFWKMYQVALRTWAQDAQPLTLRSFAIPEIKAMPEQGKYPVWEAIFVSQSRALSRTFTYSVIEAGGNLHKDVFGQVAEAWSGPRGQQKPWPIQAFKVDTDKAYQVAAEESKEYIKKNPEKPVNFLLEMTPRHPDLAWRVIWGESVGTSNYSVYVDASTGKFLEKMR